MIARRLQPERLSLERIRRQTDPSCAWRRDCLPFHRLAAHEPPGKLSEIALAIVGAVISIRKGMEFRTSILNRADDQCKAMRECSTAHGSSKSHVGQRRRGMLFEMLRPAPGLGSQGFRS